MKKLQKLLQNFVFWLASEPPHREEGIHDIARPTITFKTIEPKRTTYQAWVRWQQRFNKVRIQL